MNLSEINIYPVKSLKGISLENALVEEKGLQFDRRWMLVDEKNQFLTQREFPKMALIEVSVNLETLSFSADGKNLEVEFDKTIEKTASAKVWSSRVKSNVYEDNINDWFSNVLETKCKLVVMPQNAKRAVEPFYAVRKFKDTVSFADAFPFLLIGESSLKDLNEKLENPVPMNRFRPNLVVSGSEAFAEDTWKKIRIGETIFHVQKPCARCVMTTIDQQTAVKDGKEPLKTLAKYRTKNGKVLFGQNLIAEKAGSFVKIGDEVEILETKN
ncbi:MAG TPA: MOSC domain-containing protein [Pyrinomonadaceae bacterium]|nr:MOSC domain-containing protein [Pyrinomonadaceae bacterium]